MNNFDGLHETFVHTQAPFVPLSIMSSVGTGGRAAVDSGSSIPSGRHTPGTAPVLTRVLDEVLTFLDWFGHPNDKLNLHFTGIESG